MEAFELTLIIPLEFFTEGAEQVTIFQHLFLVLGQVHNSIKGIAAQSIRYALSNGNADKNALY